MGLVSALDRPELADEPWVGTTQPRLLGTEEDSVNLFATLREGDLLVHHPYDAFSTSVQRFIEQAAEDPHVLAIKQTLYRTDGDSPIVTALIQAAESGKQVVVLVEVKARGDEASNIGWARALERAGCHVAYGLVGLKTHSKTALVVRREHGGIRRYVHIGTGNYNAKTARLYTDLGLLSCDEDLGADLTELFNSLTGYARGGKYRKILVAPSFLRQRVVELIDRTAEKHTSRRPGRITMQMNSLVDAECIRALYAASQAGVEIDLVVRGICRLRPGVPGVSDNIRVRSIVGRFLEHSPHLELRQRAPARVLHRLGRPDAPQPRPAGRVRHPGHRPRPDRAAPGDPRRHAGRQPAGLGAVGGRQLAPAPARRGRAPGRHPRRLRELALRRGRRGPRRGKATAADPVIGAA